MQLTRPIDCLPEYANRTRWAALLGMHVSTLAKAQKSGKLGRGIYANQRVLSISKREILQWLNIPYEKPADAPHRPLKLKRKHRPQESNR